VLDIQETAFVCVLPSARGKTELCSIGQFRKNMLHLPWSLPLVCTTGKRDPPWGTQSFRGGVRVNPGLATVARQPVADAAAEVAAVAALEAAEVQLLLERLLLQPRLVLPLWRMLLLLMLVVLLRL
jgi:hypothetical protein